MNPILQNKNTVIIYGITMLSASMLYAASFGIPGNIPAPCWIIDGIVYGVILGLVGLILSNILKYAVPAGTNVFFKRMIRIVVGIMVVACATGVETLAMYACLGPELPLFTSMIFPRLFVSALAYVGFLLYYREPRDDGAAEEISPAADTAERREDLITRISVKGGQNIKVIDTEDIEYLQADGDYVRIVTGDGQWLKEQTMKHFEEHLPADKFVRIHRSYIVSLDKITRIERYDNLYQVAIRSGGKIKVSANGYKLLRQKLNL